MFYYVNSGLELITLTTQEFISEFLGKATTPKGIEPNHFYDPQTKVIHEIKKSSAKEEAHVWQVKYYIYLFEKEEIMGVKGVLEYPLLREIVSVNFEDEDREELKSMMFEIKKIVEGEMCPPRLLKKRCSQCSYFEFCYAAEECDV